MAVASDHALAARIASDTGDMLVGLLEDYIRLAPEQYLWTYRKFKGRPTGYPDVYSPSA